MKKYICLVLVVFALAGCSLMSDEEKNPERLVRISNNETISEEGAQTWPEKFCSLELGATRDEVQAIMGQPTYSFTGPYYDEYQFQIYILSNNQDWYRAWDYDLRVFYDMSDNVMVLNSNLYNIPCELTRSLEWDFGKG